MVEGRQVNASDLIDSHPNSSTVSSFPVHVARLPAAQFVDFLESSYLIEVLVREKKAAVRGDYKRSWMVDDYFDLIVWYEPGNAIHGFQLCYGKPQSEHALTWLKKRGFMHHEIDAGEDTAEWNLSPILVPDGSFPAAEVMTEFRQRSTQLPKSLRNFIVSKLRKFSADR